MNAEGGACSYTLNYGLHATTERRSSIKFIVNMQRLDIFNESWFGKSDYYIFGALYYLLLNQLESNTVNINSFKGVLSCYLLPNCLINNYQFNQLNIIVNKQCK